jgi:CDP-diacylglycerol--serine O-phosphatidyltransferase
MIISLVLIFTVMNYEWMPALLFLSYLIYGFVRPWLSKAWQREIEEEGETDEIDGEPLEGTR